MPEIIQRTVELSEPQSDVMASRASIIAEIAGQGGGKTGTLSWSAGQFIIQFPEAKGFIGANTNMQLQQSTLTNFLSTLERDYGMKQYDKLSNPDGHYVIDRAPPAHWTKSLHQFNKYNGIMSFWNGQRTFLGSLENYLAHDGKQFAWAHLDETKDTKKEALTTVILGRLRQYGLWTTKTGSIVWAPKVTAEVAKRQGLKAWNPCYIHTSPAEGSVDWLIQLLGIGPYEKEIRERIVKRDDYFFKNLVVEDEETKEKTETTVVIYSAYWNEHNLPPGFLAKRKSQLSKGQVLKFIYGHPFGKNGGEYYPNFQRWRFCKKLQYDPKLAIHTAWDFNATPYVTCLLSHVEYVTRYLDEKTQVKYDDRREGTKAITVLRFRFFKEYCIPDGTTEGTADQFVEDYGANSPDVYVNGDASGRARIEGLGAMTQYKFIENRWADKLYLSEGWLRTKKINIQNAKRRDLMNRIWEGKIPNVEIEIDETQCPNLVRDCEYLLKGVDGGKHKEKVKDSNGLKYEELGHTSDAMEYLVCDLCQDFLKE